MPPLLLAAHPPPVLQSARPPAGPSSPTCPLVQRVRLLAQHQHQVSGLGVHALGAVSLEHQAVALTGAAPAGSNRQAGGQRTGGQATLLQALEKSFLCRAPQPTPGAQSAPHLMTRCMFFVDRISAPSGLTRRRSTATLLAPPELSFARDTNTWSNR